MQKREWPVFGELYYDIHGRRNARLQHYDVLDAVDPMEEALIASAVHTAAREYNFTAYTSALPLEFALVPSPARIPGD